MLNHRGDINTFFIVIRTGKIADSLDDEAAADAMALLRQSAAACDASLVIATHDQRVVQALAGVQTLDLNEMAPQRLMDKREQL